MRPAILLILCLGCASPPPVVVAPLAPSSRAAISAPSAWLGAQRDALAALQCRLQENLALALRPVAAALPNSERLGFVNHDPPGLGSVKLLLSRAIAFTLIADAIERCVDACPERTRAALLRRRQQILALRRGARMLPPSSGRVCYGALQTQARRDNNHPHTLALIPALLQVARLHHDPAERVKLYAQAATIQENALQYTQAITSYQALLSEDLGAHPQATSAARNRLLRLLSIKKRWGDAADLCEVLLNAGDFSTFTRAELEDRLKTALRHANPSAQP